VQDGFDAVLAAQACAWALNVFQSMQRVEEKDTRVFQTVPNHPKASTDTKHATWLQASTAAAEFQDHFVKQKQELQQQQQQPASCLSLSGHIVCSCLRPFPNQHALVVSCRHSDS
jgi:hypothetical protein